MKKIINLSRISKDIEGNLILYLFIKMKIVHKKEEMKRIQNSSQEEKILRVEKKTSQK
jgi:hypothetical protein